MHRQIALKAALRQIGSPSGRFAVPSMHEAEHYEYHDILVSLKARLDDARTPYDSRSSTGSCSASETRTSGRSSRGSGEKEVDQWNNFQYLVEIDQDTLRFTHKLRQADPSWPDTTETIKIKSAHVNAKSQFVVTGEWLVETTKGHEGRSSNRRPATRSGP